MSFDNRPKAPATQEERNKMAIAFIECPEYQDDELGQNMAALIRKGLVVFTSPNLIEISAEGEALVESGQHIYIPENEVPRSRNKKEVN